MTRVAAIDCGTNSIRLLIADALDGRLRDVHREMRIVRLGQGVDSTGRFAPDALQRTRSALIDYAALCTAHGVDRIRMVATSATRDAANRDVFFEMTADVLGDVVEGAVAEVITGVEEAELSFRGAVNELDFAVGPFVIVDLGGGSTADGKFSMVEVECLGACVNAPILRANDDFYEDLDGKLTEELLDKLARDEVPPMGSMTGRQTSAPAGGPNTLTSLRFDGEH